MIAELCTLCCDKKWPEARKYLSSDAAEEEKKSNIVYCNDDGITCLHRACWSGAPADIIKTMLDIGGKELVMKVDDDDWTVLHEACMKGASYNIIKMLINVGGGDLVMAKDDIGDTALHFLCWSIKKHTKVAEKINLILQVGDANLLLSTKDHFRQTPLEIVTDNGASKRIKKLLTLQSTTSVSDMQMEAAHAQELLEESNRRAADLEATIETQRLKIADQSNEKDDIEKKFKNKVDKLMRKISKQQAQLQLLKDSSSDIEVGRMKRKHTNKDHEEGEDTVVQSQSQSSKRRKVGNTSNASSGSLNTDQAEGEDAELIDMLMSRCMAIRRELRSTKAQNIELKQEIDDLAIE
eukprot:scaffold1833_cov263-Chaetoceros_neogracile.AAC.23